MKYIVVLLLVLNIGYGSYHLAVLRLQCRGRKYV